MRAAGAGWVTWVDWATGAEAGSGKVAGLARSVVVGWGRARAARAMAGAAGWGREEEKATGKAAGLGTATRAPRTAAAATAGWLTIWWCRQRRIGKWWCRSRRDQQSWRRLFHS